MLIAAWSTVSERAKDTDHSIHWASVKIFGRENHFLSRNILEAINIHVRRPAMNRDQGYNLPPIYGTILQPHQNDAAAINSKHSHWRRSLDELRKLCLNFQTVFWRKRIFICLNDPHIFFTLNLKWSQRNYRKGMGWRFFPGNKMAKNANRLNELFSVFP